MPIWNRIDQPSPGASPKAPDPQVAPPSSAPASPREPPAPSPPTPRADLRLGRGVRLEGKLTFSGSVRLEATFKGSIVTDGTLVVGEDAKVDAEITCGTVVVEGELNGNVVASEAVELRPPARVRGAAESPSLSVDRGAIFEGASRRPHGADWTDRHGGWAAATPAPGPG